MTLLAVILCTVLFRGLLGRLSIFIGVVVGYVFAVLVGEVDFSAVAKADWIGLPKFHLPANPFQFPARRSASCPRSCPSCWCWSPRTSATSAASPS